jgi:Putative DNA-binding protein N-terminus
MLHVVRNEPHSRIEEIIKCEAEADQHQKDADELRWRAARLIAEELATGSTQRQVAAEIGKDQAHVSRMNQVWKRFGPDDHGHQGPQTGRSFDSYYQEVKNETTTDRRTQVRELADNGLSSRTIAKQLGIDDRTVRKDLSAVPALSVTPELPLVLNPDAPCDDTNCEPLNPFPGLLHQFKEFGRIIIESRRLRDEPESFEAFQRALTKLQKAADKIRKQYHDGENTTA